MNIQKKITISIVVCVCAALAIAAAFFDPRFQPVGSAGKFALSQTGLANQQAKIFRPYFDDSNWWGDLQSYNVDNAGNISATLNWSANRLLDSRSFATRRIFTRNSDGNAVMFTYGTISADQQIAIGTQNMLDFIRGDTSNEGGIYRNRVTVMGDVINSPPTYIEYDEANLSENLIAVGANDGMMHIFNAATGDEEMAYVPSEVIGNLRSLGNYGYYDDHRYYVDGQTTVRKIVLPDGTSRRPLVAGLGAGGQAFFALDMTDNDNSTDTKATDRLLWEISDDSPGMADLGFTFSRPLIAKVQDADDDYRWAAIFSNGYGNTFPDSAVGSGTAAVFVVDLYTGALIKKIDTNSGDADDPNGASSPVAIDLNADGIVDYVYAGDLNGKVWRFDLTGVPAEWGVSFSGAPFFSAINAQGEVQAITIPPRVLRHPDGGLLVLIGTGRTLSAVDADPDVDQVYSIYGLRDRFDGSVPSLDDLVVQDLNDTLYDDKLVRTSSNFLIDRDYHDGWLVDLTSGERIITELQIRSGRVVFSSTNPTIVDGEIWINEINYLTGGTPSIIVYDMDDNGLLNTDDNTDGNNDGDTEDLEDRVTGLYQGHSIVVSSPTMATLSATSGTYFVNRINASPLDVAEHTDPGIAGGHFDVDTTSYIAEINTGNTDAHVHEYDDDYDVKGVDYFEFFDEPAKLHEIFVDVEADQLFKIVIVNAHLSTGGRLSFNNTYDENNAFSYVPVPFYADIAVESLPIFSLSGTNAFHLTGLGMYFDRNAILDRGLVPGRTGCVKSNTLSSQGDWRNGALTTWAVAVDEDGVDDFTLTYDADDPTKIVGIESGLLFESTLFWHWKGPCAHEYESLDDLYDPDDPESESIWEKWAALTLQESKDKEKDKDKEKKKDKTRTGDENGRTAT